MTDLRVTISNNTIETYLMQVGRLQFQHLLDSIPVDGVCSFLHLRGSTIRATECSCNQILTVSVEKIESMKIRTRRDLDQLSEAVADLRLWQSAKESEIKESLHWCVVGTKTILVVAIVDGNLDRHRGVNQTDDGGRDADVVAVSAVGSASVPVELSAASSPS